MLIDKSAIRNKKYDSDKKISNNLTISIYKLGMRAQKTSDLPKVVELVTGEHRAPDFESTVLFDALKTQLMG